MTGSSSIARPRTQRSCLPCTRRKVGCDRVRPTCGRCRRSGLVCSYGPNQTGPVPLRFIDETPNLTSEGGRQSGQRGAAARGAATTAPAPAQTSSVPKRIERLDQMLQSMNEEYESGSTSDNTQTGSDIGHLYSLGDGGTKYVSGAFWAMISQEVSPGLAESDVEEFSYNPQIAEINDLLQRQHSLGSSAQGGSSMDDLASFGAFMTPAQNLPDQLADPLMQQPEQLFTGRPLYGDIFHHFPNSSFSERFSGGGSPMRQLATDQLLAAMPNVQQSNLLVWAYMRGHHAIAPLLHGPTFLSNFLAFQAWREQGQGICPFSPHFIAFLCAVFFAGYAVCPIAEVRQAFGNTPRETALVHLYDLAVQAIRGSKFPNSPSLESLAAFIVIDTVWLREEQPLACCAFVGLAVRVAQMLGLHKATSSFPGMPLIEAEVRRRIWWQVVACDIGVAVAAGLVPLIHPASYDVRTISELPEGRLMDPASQSEPNPQKSILGILAGGRIFFFSRVNVLVRILNATKLSRADIDKALNIVGQIQRHMAERIERVLEIEIPDFQPYHWTWPGQNQPLHALVAIIQDLDDHPQAAGADETRQLVDLAVCMSSAGPSRAFGARPSPREAYSSGEVTPWSEGAEGMESWGINAPDIEGNIFMRPLTEGGSEAWSFIRRMRRRVWRRAGLDPALLTCPDRADQIDLERAVGGGARGRGGTAPSMAPSPSAARRENHSSGSSSSGGSISNDESERGRSLGRRGRMRAHHPSSGSRDMAAGAIPTTSASTLLGSSATAPISSSDQRRTFDASGTAEYFYHQQAPQQHQHQQHQQQHHQHHQPLQHQPTQHPQGFAGFGAAASAALAPDSAAIDVDEALFHEPLPETDEGWAQFANSLDPHFFDDDAGLSQQQSQGRSEPGAGAGAGSAAGGGTRRTARG